MEDLFKTWTGVIALAVEGAAAPVIVIAALEPTLLTLLSIGRSDALGWFVAILALRILLKRIFAAEGARLGRG